MEALGRIKKGKQPGPDRLKGEIYMGLRRSEKLVSNNEMLKEFD